MAPEALGCAPEGGPSVPPSPPVSVHRRRPERSREDWEVRVRECGAHSGIPACCVDFFAGSWTDLVLEVDPDELAGTVVAYHDLADAAMRAGGAAVAHYVMCPDCLAAAATGGPGPVRLLACRCGEPEGARR